LDGRKVISQKPGSSAPIARPRRRPRRIPPTGAGANAARPAEPQALKVRPDCGPWLQLGPIRQYEWNTLHLPIDALPASLQTARLLHLSDLHLRAGRWHPALDELITRTRDHPPDAVLITGDFVDDKFDHSAALPLVEKLVTSLRAREGIFAILGNHDGDLLGPRLPAWGVSIITGQRLEIAAGEGGRIELVGLPGVGRQDLAMGIFAETLPPRQPGVPRIALAHFPDSIEHLGRLDPDIFLAGHTHGGQICLPGGLPILTHSPLPRRLSKGLHRVGRTWYVVSRGMGYSHFACRVFCPAEVIELKLQER
jgi:predicted MPP superfamily phosphohydrolase